MKTIIIIFITLNIILSNFIFADLSKMIHIPNESEILSLTFRYIDTNGNIQTQKLKSDIPLTYNGIFLSQSKQKHFLAKIEIDNISRINYFVIKYKDKSNNTFYKPIYYDLAILDKDKPLYILEKEFDMHNNMNNDERNMPITFNEGTNELIDGFNLNKIDNSSYQKKANSNIHKTKVMKFKKYNLSYVNNIMHPVVLNGIDISKEEKHFCTIPIRDNIFYFIDKKTLFVIFKDFELISGMSVDNNKLILRFEQENTFRPCVLNNINKNIIKMSAFYEDRNNGEAWFVVNFSSNIKSASVVYPKEKSDIMSYSEELKDIVIYKIEY
jgi:hypothetical protein